MSKEKQVKLEGKLLRITAQYLSSGITTEEWQRLILAELKESNVRVVVLAAGGREAININRFNREYFTTLREDLTNIATGLSVFTAAVLAGQKTAGQIRQWAKYQSRTVFRNYSKAELLTRMSLQRANEAARSLDPAVHKHCPECPAYGHQW